MRRDLCIAIGLGLMLGTGLYLPGNTQAAIVESDGASHSYGRQNITNTAAGAYVGGFSGSGSAYYGAIQSNNSGTVVNLSGSTTINTSALNVGYADNFGIVSYKGGTTTINGDLNITSDAQTNFDNHGIGIKAGGVVNVTGNTVLNVGENNGKYSSGIYFRDTTTGNAANFGGDLTINIDAKNTITAIASESTRNMITVGGKYSLNIDTQTAGTVYGSRSVTFDLKGDSHVEITQDIDNTWGAVGYRSGVVKTAEGTNHVINITVGKNAYQAHGLEYTNFTLAKNATMTVNVTAPTENAIYIPEVQTGISGILTGVYNTGEGSVTNITVAGHPINTTSGWGGTVGLDIYGKSTLDGALNVNVTTPQGVGLRMSADNSAGYTSQMILNGDVNVQTNNGYAILSVGGDSDAGEVLINQNGGSTVKLLGDIDTRGTKQQLIDVKMDDANSYLTGAILMTGTNTDNATNLGLANGATWNLTADSVVTDLAMNNNGYLNMNYTGTGTYEKLKTQNFTGTTGHIMMSTDLQSSKDAMNVQGNSDRIKIIDGSSGTYVVDIADTSSLNGTAAEGYLLLIEDAYWKDKDYNNMATFVGGNLRKGGIFKYKPIITNVDPDAASGYSGVTTDQRPDGCGGAGLGHNPPCDNPEHVWTKQSWYLTASEKTDELTESVKPVLGSASARYMSYWRELDTLLQRLGELRQDENAQGIWARYRRGEQSVSNVGVKSSQYNMAQLGYDYQTSKSKSGARNLLGLAFNHTWGDEEYINAATGSSGANVFSLYDTWLGNKGHYWDIVGKVGRIYKDFTYAGDDYLNVPDSASDGGLFYSLGVEYGRKKMLGNKGWYAEPQAQLTYGRVNSTDYTTDQFVDVHTNAMNSLIGRMGITLGREISNKENNKTNIYGKIFWNREFRGDLSTHMSDSYGDTYDHTDDYTGNWLTAGFGVTGKISKNQNVYLDLEKTFGGQINTKWQFQAGYRLMW